MSVFDVKVKLTGQDGNAFNLLGIMTRALYKAGATEEQVKEFQKDATSGDYDHLLQTCMRWVDVS